ncbi:MAG: MoaD/ThiS family protein [Candidatus Eisenbacteria bacterium]
MSSSRSERVEITVLLFAQIRLAAGVDRVDLSVAGPDAPTVKDALAALLEKHPEIEAHLSSSRVAVGMDYASLDHPVRDGDELSLIPPVQGG